MKTLQERMKVARKAAGRSQTDVAEAVGMTQPSYSELERGLSVTTSKVVEIAIFLQVSSRWLATGDGEMRGGDLLSNGSSDLKSATNEDLLRELFRREEESRLSLEDVAGLELLLQDIKTRAGAIYKKQPQTRTN